MYKKSITTLKLVQPHHDQLTVYISREIAALFSYASSTTLHPRQSVGGSLTGSEFRTSVAWSFVSVLSYLEMAKGDLFLFL